MGRRIHTRIFWLVMAVILLMTVSTWSVFAVTSQWYVRAMAEREGERVIRTVEGLEKEVYRNAPEPEDRTPQEDREYSKELLKQLRQCVKSGEIRERILVFNSRFKMVYPASPDEEAIPDRFAQACAAMIQEGRLDTAGSGDLEEGGENWNIRLFTADAEHNVRAKYVVAAVQVPDLRLLWSYTGGLFLFILAGTVCMAAGMIWMVAAGIARPIRQLCQQAEAIGDGKGGQMEGVYSVRELDMLKEAHNRMERKIRENEQEKERFFQNISHDLRTPLASIIGYAQGIQCGVMKDHKKAAGIILTESMRMMNLVEGILTLAKMDSRDLKLHKTTVDLEEFLEERVDALRGLAGGEKLRLEPAGQDIYLRTDPELLGRILENILSNCIRYGKQEVRIRYGQVKDRVEIRIEDDGAGFGQEDMSQVFRRFYQGKKGNFGIGLSVVQAGAEYLGGQVEIGNRQPPDQGAFYRLVLPGGTDESERRARSEESAL